MGRVTSGKLGKHCVSSRAAQTARDLTTDLILTQISGDRLVTVIFVERETGFCVISPATVSSLVVCATRDDPLKTRN